MAYCDGCKFVREIYVYPKDKDGQHLVSPTGRVAWCCFNPQRVGLKNNTEREDNLRGFAPYPVPDHKPIRALLGIEDALKWTNVNGTCNFWVGKWPWSRMKGK